MEIVSRQDPRNSCEVAKLWSCKVGNTLSQLPNFRTLPNLVTDNRQLTTMYKKKCE